MKKSAWFKFLVICVCFYGVIPTSFSQAPLTPRYGVRFHVYVGTFGIGCTLCPVARGNIAYYLPGSSSPTDKYDYVDIGRGHTYELRTEDDPHDYLWMYHQTPWTGCTNPGSCAFPFAGNIPLYNGPKSCGEGIVDKPWESSYPSLYIVSEYSDPEMTAPVAATGLDLTNLCADEFAVQTTKWSDEEMYIWQVSKDYTNGPWVDLKSTTTSSATLTRSEIETKLNDFNLQGKSLYLRVKPGVFNSCNWYDRTSAHSLMVFNSDAPFKLISTFVPPTCQGGKDGKIVIQDLLKQDNSDYTFTGNLLYTISEVGGVTHNIPSSKNPSPADPLYLTVPADEGGLFSTEWNIQIETSTRNCASKVFSQVISDPPAFQISTASIAQPIVCLGGTGALSISVQHDHPPYHYILKREDGTQVADHVSNNTTHVFTGVASGTYKIEVYGLCNKVLETSTIKLSEPTDVVTISTITSTPEACVGAGNGQLQTSISGGASSAYSISIQGGPWQAVAGASHTHTNLAQGNYSIRVKDASGCLYSRNATVNASPPPNGYVRDEDVVPVYCKGGSNGSVQIQVHAKPGVTYQYGLNGAFQNNNQFSNLAAGTYTVSLRNAAYPMCRWDSTTLIVEPTPLVFSKLLQSLPIECYGAAEGEIQVRVTGGNMPPAGYNYSLFNITIPSSSIPVDFRTSTSQVVFSNLVAGNYRITVDNGSSTCQVSNTIQINQPAALSLFTTTSQYNGFEVSCPGKTDGRIHVKSVGGVYPKTVRVLGWPSKVLNGDADEVSFTNVGVGIYTVMIEDANGCTNQSQVELNAPTSLTIGLSPVVLSNGNHVSCFSGNDGVLTATGSGGVGPYSFQITPAGAVSQVNNIISNYNFTQLSAGNYQVVVTDKNLCTANAFRNLTAPTQINISSLVSAPVACSGATNGQVTATIEGGSPAYSVSVQGGPWQAVSGTLYTHSNLAQGNYSIQVQDASGCLYSRNATVAASPPPHGYVRDEDVVAVYCKGGSDGSVQIQVQATPGVTYQYALNGAFQNSNQFSNLAAGTYAVSLRNAAYPMCRWDSTVLVTEPTPLVFSTLVQSLPIECFAAEGEILVRVTGGNMPPAGYNYSLFNITIPSSPALVDSKTSTSLVAFSNLVAGNYRITVDNGSSACQISSTMQINQPAALSLLTTTSEYNGFEVSCPGKTDGSIYVKSVGGVYPKTVSMLGWPSKVLNGDADEVSFTNAGVGIYTVMIEDANGCTNQSLVELKAPTSVMIDLSPVVLSNGENLSCFGGNDGVITATGSGGVGPYSFQITPAGVVSQVDNIISNYNFTQLSAGTYQVVVTDKNVCTANSSSIITAPLPLVVSNIVSSPVACSGASNGQFTVNIEGGSPAYSISVQGGPWQPVTGNTHLESNLSEGNYTVLVRDAFACQDNDIAIVGSRPAPQGYVRAQDIQHVTCKGASNASVAIQAIPQAGVTYEYGLNGVYTSSNTFSNLSAGNYTVSIRNTAFHICTWDSIIQITEPTTLVLNTLLQTKFIDCFGAANAEIQVQALGGIMPALGYTYLLEDVSVPAVPNIVDSKTSIGLVTFAGLGAGEYRITVFNGVAGCQINGSLQISQPTALLLQTSTTQYNGYEVSCPEKTDGKITCNSIAGFYPKTVSISGWPSQILNSDAEFVSFSNLGAADYFVSIEDANGCNVEVLVSMEAPSKLNLSLAPIVLPNGKNVSCFGALDGTLTATATGGVAPFEMEIVPAGSVSMVNNIVSQYNFTQLGVGAYQVLVKDQNLCTASTNAVLNGPDKLVVTSIERSDVYGKQVKCHGDDDAFAKVFTDGGTFPHTVSVSGVDVLVDASTTEALFSNLSAGMYQVQVVDMSGCTANENVEIEQPELLKVPTASITITQPDCFGQITGALEIAAEGGVPVGSTYVNSVFTEGNQYQYRLLYQNLPDDLPFVYEVDRQLVSDVALFQHLLAGTHQLQVTDLVGCQYAQPIVINTRNQVLAQVVTQPVICKQDANGSAQLEVSGGVFPYEIKWKFNQKTILVNTGVGEHSAIEIQHLPEGLYEFLVTDANGCTYYNGDFSVQIDGPPLPLEIKPTVTNVSCTGFADGQIQLSAIGGWTDVPYEFGLQKNALSSSQTSYQSLSPGVYTFYVQDNKGCLDSIDVSITEPLPLQSHINTSEMVSCFGLADGEFSLNTIGGTSPYRSSVDGGVTWKLNGTHENLIASTYSIVVEDAHGCSVTINMDITQPQALDISLIELKNSLCNEANGSITVSGVGGTLPYNYEWKNQSAQSLGTGLSVQNLYPGTYTFSIQDNHLCSASKDFIVINDNDIVFNVMNIEGVSCHGFSDGKAALEILQIQSPYTITWDNVAGSVQTNNLNAGLHKVILEDVNHCKVEKVFQVPTPDPLEVQTINVTQPVCFNVCTGEVSVKGLGGTAPYTFEWSNGFTSEHIQHLCSGNYTVKISDSHSCSTELNVPILNPSKHLIGIEDTVYHICQGQQQHIQLNNWIQYQWTSDNGFSSIADQVLLTNAGHYQLEAIDALGCMSSAQFEVIYSNDVLKTEFLMPREAYVSDTIVCVDISKPASSVGQWLFDKIVATDLGVIGAYQQIVFLVPGTYQVQLKSNLNGCVDQQSKWITILGEPPHDEQEIELGYKEEGIKNILLYPNPNSGEFEFNVELYKEEMLKVRLLDNNGNELKRWTSEEKTMEFVQHVSMGLLQNGTYCLVVEAGEDLETVKVLLSR